MMCVSWHVDQCLNILGTPALCYQAAAKDLGRENNRHMEQVGAACVFEMFISECCTKSFGLRRGMVYSLSCIGFLSTVESFLRRQGWELLRFD